MKSKLRNFNLTLEEIKIVKMIGKLVEDLDNLGFKEQLSPQAVIFRKEIETLEEKLEEVRENTLIKF